MVDETGKWGKVIRVANIKRELIRGLRRGHRWCVAARIGGPPSFEVSLNNQLCRTEGSRHPAFGQRGDIRNGCAPWKGGAFLWVQVPPGNRSSRKQPEQSWR
jgi:hypothetical protein